MPLKRCSATEVLLRASVRFWCGLTPGFVRFEGLDGQIREFWVDDGPALIAAARADGWEGGGRPFTTQYLWRCGMCARMRISGRVYRPGDIVVFARAITGGLYEGRWGSPRGRNGAPPFARFETLRQKWLVAGWKTGHIEADDFAERSASGNLVWAGKSSRLAVVYKDGQVAVVTRPASTEEKTLFGHSRVPVEVRDGKAFIPEGGTR